MNKYYVLELEDTEDRDLGNSWLIFNVQHNMLSLKLPYTVYWLKNSQYEEHFQYKIKISVLLIEECY